MKFFGLNDSALFVPPRPDVFATALGIGAGFPRPTYPAFGDFFATYFAGRSFNVTETRCAGMLDGMKRCYENHTTADPVNSCAYYIQGFERFACGRDWNINQQIIQDYFIINFQTANGVFNTNQIDK